MVNRTLNEDTVECERWTIGCIGNLTYMGKFTAIMNWSKYKIWINSSASHIVNCKFTQSVELAFWKVHCISIFDKEVTTTCVYDIRLGFYDIGKTT